MPLKPPPAVRVRFAPSPTGYLHVGSARTALFNWLFARHHGGAFVLRIEDTDKRRNREEYRAGIFAALRWLGLAWDEGPDVGGAYGPYAQSQRMPLYRETAQALVARGAAYECFCAAAEDEPSAGEGEADEGAPSLAARPHAAGGRPPDCRCAQLAEGERMGLRESVSPALRLRVDQTRVMVVHDIVRGAVTFPPGTLADFVIVKSGGDPLYNFAAAVDDHHMAISHVIRGEEHLANTPKQVLVYEALGWTPPAFAHIPIILNEQRRKLSKREGATFVNDYEAQGFLPEALVNFLALLGWSPGNDRELLTVGEMVDEFSIESVVKHPAIFDAAKLAWMNKEYLRKLPLEELARKTADLLARRAPGQAPPPLAYVAKVAGLLQERARTLADIVDQGKYFFDEGPVQYAPEALAKYCAAPETPARLRLVRQVLAQAPGFESADVETAIRGLAERTNAKAAVYIHPLRVALTGQAVSPGIFEVCAILGRARVLGRIDALVAHLGHRDGAVGVRT